MNTEIVRQVGPGGEFLTCGQTLELFREEVWYPELLSRRTLAGWEDGGSKDLSQRAHELTAALLASHVPVAYDERTLAEFDAILTRANERLGETYDPGVFAKN